MGVSGRVACLMSGGIDSPVAAWRMMRRGCRAQLIHFHGYPFQSAASQDKARELARILTRYQLRSRLYMVPFGEVQRQVVVSVPAPIRVVIYRRLMLRIAERLALWEGAQRPGDGRRGRAGGVADAGEPARRSAGRHAAGVSAAGRHGQGRDRRRRAADRDLCDLHPARRGLLPAVHARQPADPGHRRRSRCGRGIIAACGSHRTGRLRHHRRGLPVADGRIDGSAQMPALQIQSRRHDGATARRTLFIWSFSSRRRTCFRGSPGGRRSMATPSR